MKKCLGCNSPQTYITTVQYFFSNLSGSSIARLFLFYKADVALKKGCTGRQPTALTREINSQCLAHTPPAAIQLQSRLTPALCRLAVYNQCNKTLRYTIGCRLVFSMSHPHARAHVVKLGQRDSTRFGLLSELPRTSYCGQYVTCWGIVLQCMSTYTVMMRTIQTHAQATIRICEYS